MLRLTDPTAVGDSIEVLNMDVINLNPEGFEYRHTSVPLNECCLIYQKTNTAMRTHSRVHADFESCWILGPQARGNLDGKKGVFVIPEGHEVWYPARQETQELFELGTRIAEAAENSPEVFNDNHWARYGAQVEFMGMSPLSFLQRLRLHRARDELRKAKRDSASVTNVAMNWGFWHFSDFSQAYRNCFDELPSETLRRDS